MPESARKELTCPDGHAFGREHDMHDDCDVCPEETYKACCEKFCMLVKGDHA